MGNLESVWPVDRSHAIAPRAAWAQCGKPGKNGKQAFAQSSAVPCTLENPYPGGNNVIRLRNLQISYCYSFLFSDYHRPIGVGALYTR
jgi:hypothetical protein